jgi:hypothetical protein
MANPIDELLDRMHTLREELEIELDRKRDEIRFVIQDKRAHFAHEVEQRHLLHKVGLLRYLRGARLTMWLTAPVVYSGFIAFLVMDVFLTVYQATCFTVYGIPKVRRSDYLVFDRGDLAYLNILERFNCFYCSYGNGVAAYLREIAARTEQYWCPIKHARRILGVHDRYPQFFEFGDAESYRQGLERLRQQYESTRSTP